MFVLSVSICEIVCQNVYDLDLHNGPRSNVNMPIERPYQFLLLAIEMFVLLVAVCELISYDLSNFDSNL